MHTKDGLKPIEKIQVGELVFSRHEIGQGELCYSPVTQTFQYENREVYFVSFQLREAGTGNPTKGRDHMVVTGAHPNWILRFQDYGMPTEEIKASKSSIYDAGRATGNRGARYKILLGLNWRMAVSRP